MASLRIELIEEPDKELADAVNAFLRQFNQAENPVWWQAMHDPANEPRSVDIVAYNDSHELIGGLFGETCLSWLKVRIMAVREDHRREGLGMRLLVLAENEAIQRGCKYAFLDTMQYQAPEFYKRRGYEVSGMIADWDSHGHAKYFMTKSLVARDA